MKQLFISETPSLIEENRRIHKLLTDGVDVEFSTGDGAIKGDKVWLIDFDEPENNDWLVTNQFTVVEGHNNRRPDMVVFVNGLPLAVIELKNAGDENATIEGAYNQLQTYKAQIPSLFRTNAALVTSDGMLARIGSLTADAERFMPWRTVCFTQDKTEERVEMPILAPLAEALPRDRMTFLMTEHGKPFSVAGFGNWFREQCESAGVRKRAHGLRKAAGGLLAEMGCTENEIMAVLGHADERTTAIYTRSASRRMLAKSAMNKMARFKW